MFDRHKALSRLLTLPAAILALYSCGGDKTEDVGSADGPTTPSESVTVAAVGFATPESVLHDVAADVYLVSNVNGGPLDKDGNGFISRLSPEGEVLELKWIDGEADGVELSAPKGMAIQGERLYVTDIDCVRFFNLRSGDPEGEVCIDGATFLNDVTSHPERGVIFTDMGRDAAFEPTGTDAVYHLSGESYAPIVADPNLDGPNGVTMRGGDLVMVSFFGGEIFIVTENAAEPMMPALEGAQLDGVEVLDDGRLLLSDWGSSCILVIDAEAMSTCIVENVEGPADIGIDRKRNRVLIPLFNSNEVWFRPIQ
jgi:hypothetical protein